MVDFILVSENVYFSIALTIMFGIAVLEGITILLGFALSSVLDSLLPDFDFEIDVASELEVQSSLARMLAWLRVGKVPVLMLLVIFLTSFGLIGFAIQAMLQTVTGTLLPAAIAAIPAFILSIPVLRLLGNLIHKYLPNDESSAVSEVSFIGRIATLTLANASKGHPVEAKLKDEHGKTHYVMLEPDGDFELPVKSKVLIVRKDGAVFKAIENTNSSLIDV
ncbi:MAG: YqiJ family protein [Gammaproteobacteria bacterium]|nr:YqiJ family protein [Gammaproteobacteria bacterium]